MTKEKFQKIKQLLELGWCQKYSKIKTSHGISYYISGACYEVSANDGEAKQIRKIITGFIPKDQRDLQFPISTYNDNEKRIHAEIIALMDIVISSSE